MGFSQDTIAALATPPGVSALAVLRVSGPAVGSLMELHLGASRRPLQPRQMERRVFRSKDGAGMDDVLAVWFPGPNSYTGEDVLEIFPHGNPVLIRQILRAMAEHPEVRSAEPGEFTRRAFENGKLDLIQAEAVGAMIHATTESVLANARKLLQGELSSKIRNLADRLQWLSAKMELAVDFAEEEADPELEGWSLDLDVLAQELESMLRAWERQSRSGDIPRIALCGRPNAGKSSLINALVEEDRLLVSSQAGTTRDYVEVPLWLEGGQILLVDTAGLGEAVDDLDALSQQRSLLQAAKADFVMWISDGTQGVEDPQEHIGQTANLCIQTHGLCEGFVESLGAFVVDSKQGLGIAALRKRLGEIAFSKEQEAEAWMSTERQAEGIRRALEAVDRAKRLLATAQVELLAFELREARLAVEEITGEITADDILNALFGSFCIGK